VLEKGVSNSSYFRSEGTEGLENSEKTCFQTLLDDVRKEWRLLWLNRIDDKVRAEGMANRDFSLLFVDRGTVIVATRDFKPLDLREILNLHKIENVERFVSPHPSVGGWRKFARTVLNKQKRAVKSKKSKPFRKNKKKLQLKKGGKGWLHYNVNE
jgi:hypothetical protein